MHQVIRLGTEAITEAKNIIEQDWGKDTLFADQEVDEHVGIPC